MTNFLFGKEAARYDWDVHIFFDGEKRDSCERMFSELLFDFQSTRNVLYLLMQYSDILERIALWWCQSRYVASIQAKGRESSFVDCQCLLSCAYGCTWSNEKRLGRHPPHVPEGCLSEVTWV